MYSYKCEKKYLISKIELYKPKFPISDQSRSMCEISFGFSHHRLRYIVCVYERFMLS